MHPAPPHPSTRQRRPRRPNVRRLALALGAAVTLAATAWAARPMPNAPAPARHGAAAAAATGTTPLLGQSSRAPDLQLAEHLFVGTCAACHGIRGQGAGMPGMGFPALDATSDAWQKSDEELQLIVQGGKGSMPGVGSSWTASDIRDVLALLRSWWTPEQQARHDALSTSSAP